MARGRKTGGRRAGTPNRATVERQRIRDKHANGSTSYSVHDVMPVGKQELGDCCVIARMEFERWHKSKAKVARARAEAWFDRWERAAGKLAPFQSPQYRAILMQPPPLDVKQVEGVANDKPQEITLRVFEGGRLALPPVSKGKPPQDEPGAA